MKIGDVEINIEIKFKVEIMGIWLTCWGHKIPRYKSMTNYWSPMDVVRMWRRGYRKFAVTLERPNLDDL